MKTRPLSPHLCAGMALVAACALGACESSGAPAHPTLLTVTDFEALLAKPLGPTAVVAPDHGVPGGIPLSRIISPDSAGKPTLTPELTFTNGYRSTYLTTELWTGFDAVWIQPMYVPVTGYAANGTPIRAKGASGAWHPIFGVGKDSAFYSPFWQTIYFELPAGATVDSFQSVRDVIDRGLNLNPAGGYLAVLAPADVGLPAQDLMPADGSLPVGGPARGMGVIDGQMAPFLDFGEGLFSWNEDLVVQEAPIFEWVVRDKAGELQRLDIPTVAGEGPLYSGAKPKGGAGMPLYGAYWRLYTVELPVGAAVFAPTTFPDIRAGLAGHEALYDFTYAAASEDMANVSEYATWAGRVATDPKCFGDADDIDPTNHLADGCTYLDSQSAIESLVSTDAIHRTDIVVTSPFITYEEVAVVSP